jgi:lysozyme
MKPRYKVSSAGTDLIKAFEGFRQSAAQLDDGRWTIGYGHTKSARSGVVVSEEDADALLIYDLIEVSSALNSQIFTPLTQNQFDALASFTFNIGVPAFGGSLVLRRVNEGALLEAANALEAWRKADFQGATIVVDALVRRRAAEKALFLTPPAGWTPAPTPVLPPKLDEISGRIEAPVKLRADLTGETATVAKEEETEAVADVVAPTQPHSNGLNSAAAEVAALAAVGAATPLVAEALEANSPEAEVTPPEAAPVAVAAPEDVPGNVPEARPEEASTSHMQDASAVIAARLRAILPGPDAPKAVSEPEPAAPEPVAEAAEAKIEEPVVPPLIISRDPILPPAPVETQEPEAVAEAPAAVVDREVKPIYRDQNPRTLHPFVAVTASPLKQPGLILQCVVALLALAGLAAALILNLPKPVSATAAVVCVIFGIWAIYRLISRLGDPKREEAGSKPGQAE